LVGIFLINFEHIYKIFAIQASFPGWKTGTTGYCFVSGSDVHIEFFILLAKLFTPSIKFSSFLVDVQCKVVPRMNIARPHDYEKWTHSKILNRR
jgi:hypothetical protein